MGTSIATQPMKTSKKLPIYKLTGSSKPTRKTQAISKLQI